MAFDRTLYLANHQRLTAANGDHLPAWDERAQAIAGEAAVARPEAIAPDNPLSWRRPLDFLAVAYRETRAEPYAEAARHALEADFKRAPEFMTPGMTLGISTMLGRTRFGGWLLAVPHLLASPAFDDAFGDSFSRHAGDLLDYLAAFIGQGNMNWRLAHADTLLLGGLLLEGVCPNAAAWRTVGLDALNDAYYRQWLPDGSHIERNPHYHMWPLCIMDGWHEYAQAVPDLGLVFGTDQLSRMWDYALGATRPNGDENGMHDSNAVRAGRVDNLIKRYRDAFRKRCGLPAGEPAPRQWFPDAGQAFLRDAWTEGATYVTFDATRWGSDHAHLSRNTVQVHAGGRTVLCDIGWLSDTGTYTTKPMGLYSKSTRAHNTLNLNGWNQTRTDPSRTTYRQCEGYDFVRSDYEGGYFPGEQLWGYVTPAGKGIWASHHRALLWIHGRAIVVIDSLYRERIAEPEAEGDVPSLEMNWQFCEGGKLPAIDQAAGRLTTGFEDANALVLFPLLPEGTTWNLYEGSRNPFRGWVSKRYCEKGIQPAPQLCLRLPRMTDQWAELITVIIPYAGTHPPEIVAEGKHTKGDNIGGVTLRWGDGTTDHAWWFYRTELMIGAKVEGFETDASLVHLQRTREGKLIRGAALDGTYVRPFAVKPLPKPAFFRFA